MLLDDPCLAVVTQHCHHILRRETLTVGVDEDCRLLKMAEIVFLAISERQASLLYFLLIKQGHLNVR